MPDKWEYPWYAAWDLAFQCISMAVADPTFAKHQLLLIMREWYMKPDGQLPAYEWNFSDVNPPVHAWAAMQVYNIEKKQKGTGDIVFLKKIFQKLLINFTWWINRKDGNGNNIFEGGFLGLDNIGVFNRSFHFPGEMQLEQADGTSWMGTYALNMMDMALEIAMHDPSFEDTATKFFEHFVLIAEALNEHGFWNEEDKFFYDVLVVPGAEPTAVADTIHSGTDFAVCRVDHSEEKCSIKLKDFKKRINGLKITGKRITNSGQMKKEVMAKKCCYRWCAKTGWYICWRRLLDEEEFLSPGGIRALSKLPRQTSLFGNRGRHYVYHPI